MTFWEIFLGFLFCLYLNEAFISNAAPLGGSSRNCEFRLQYLKQDAKRQHIFFDIVTEEGKPTYTTFRHCKLTGHAEAEFPHWLEIQTFEHLSKVVVVVDNTTFSRRSSIGLLGRTANLFCNDCIELRESEFGASEKQVQQSQRESFPKRKLQSITTENTKKIFEAAPFLTLFIAFGGVIILVVTLGLCASCFNQKNSASPRKETAQLVSVTAVKSVRRSEHESQRLDEVTETRERNEAAENENHVDGETGAVAQPDNAIAPLTLFTGEATSGNMTLQTEAGEYFEQECSAGIKGRKTKTSKRKVSSSVSSDRSSRGSSKFDDENRGQDKSEKDISEHKDDKHDKHLIGEKLHGLKKKLSIKAAKESHSNISETDEKTTEKERQSVKCENFSLFDKGMNSKGSRVKEPYDAATHKASCSSPPYNRASRELPKLPFESDPTTLGPSSFGRPLPEKGFSLPVAALENNSYKSHDVRLHSRGGSAVSVGDVDTLYETVETKSKEPTKPNVRTSSITSQQYEAVDFVQLQRVAMQNRAAYNKDNEYSEVPDTIKSHLNKADLDDQISVASSENDLYTTVKDDVRAEPVLDLYAEVNREEIGGGNTEDTEEKVKKDLDIPSLPSVDRHRSIPVSGRSLSESDSFVEESISVVRSHSESKAQGFLRETDPKKLEQMYSKIDFALKKRNPGSGTVKVFHRQDDDDNQLNDDGDEDTPPPVPSCLYAPVPTVDEGCTEIDGEKTSLPTLEDAEKKRLSNVSLTYEEIGRIRADESKNEVKSATLTHIVSGNENLLTAEICSSGSKRISTGSEAYEEIIPMQKSEQDCKNQRPSNGLEEGRTVNMKMKSASYEDVRSQGDGASTYNLYRAPPETSQETLQPDNKELVNGNVDVKTLVQPRIDGNTSGYYETLENIDFSTSSATNSKRNSQPNPVETEPSLLVESKGGVPLYEEVVVRKDEKKTKKMKMTTLGHI